MSEASSSGHEDETEVDGRPRGTAPHRFAVHTYKSPTFCQLCGDMLFGVVKQVLLKHS